MILNRKYGTCIINMIIIFNNAAKAKNKNAIKIIINILQLNYHKCN